MSDRDDESPNWALERVKPATRDLVNAIIRDEWPRPYTMVDFGLATQEHYEAAYYAIRSGEVSPAELDEAICSGPRLTELLASAPSNPHKEIVFETDWDRMPVEEDLEPGLENQETSHRGTAEVRYGGKPGFDIERVGHSTRDLVETMTSDDLPSPLDVLAYNGWPSVPTMTDFGIKGPEHYEAIFYALRNGEITPAELDGACGDGPKLTELVRGAPSNPHKGITFETPSGQSRSEDRTADAEPKQVARQVDRDIDRER